MSAMPTITSVSWTNSNVDPAASPSTDSLVRSWLNQNGIKDLTQMSAKDLEALIAFLNQNTTVPGVSNLVQQLTQLQTEWAASSNSGDKLTATIDGLKHQSKFLDILAQTTTGQDGLDTAKSNIDSALKPLENLKKALLQGTLSLDKDDGQGTKKNVENLLAQMDELKNNGADLGSLGLQNLYDQLKTALDSYSKALQEAGDDPTKISLAGSHFRQDVASAKKEYLLSTGLPENHALVENEANASKSEDVYQKFLTTPMDENWRPDAPGTTVTSIENAYKEAERMYQDAVSRGDTDSVNYFRERMSILGKGVADLKAGKENTLVVIVTMYTSLLTLDTVRLETLKVRALDANNQSLADKINQRIESIGQLIQEIFKGEVKLLGAVENSLASVR